MDHVLVLCGRLFTWVGSLGLFVLIGLTVADVLWRYGLNDPIFGLIDISAMTSSVVVACAVVWAALSEAHVVINLIDRRLNARTINAIGRVISVASGLVFVAAAFALMKKSSCGFACGDITDNLAIPHRPFYWALALSMAFCAVLYIWRGLRPTADFTEQNIEE